LRRNNELKDPLHQPRTLSCKAGKDCYSAFIKGELKCADREIALPKDFGAYSWIQAPTGGSRQVYA